MVGDGQGCDYRWGRKWWDLQDVYFCNRVTVAAAVAIAVAVVTEMFTKVIPAKRMIEF